MAVWGRQPKQSSTQAIYSQGMPFFWGHFVILIWDTFVGPWYRRNHFNNNELPGWFNKYNLKFASNDPSMEVFWKGSFQYKALLEQKRKNKIPWYVPVVMFKLKNEDYLPKDYWYNFVKDKRKRERRVDAFFFILYNFITIDVWLCWLKIFQTEPLVDFLINYLNAPIYYMVFLYWWFFLCKSFRLTCYIWTFYIILLFF